MSVFGTTYTFTNAGQVGRTGPSQSNVNVAYTGTSLEGAVTVSNGIQSWNVPTTGRYRIEVWGAAGGFGYTQEGYGAKIVGEFDLTAGDALKVLVGQKGEGFADQGSGGGGGTFVYKDCSTPLIIAGGGAGANDEWITKDHVSGGVTYAPPNGGIAPTWIHAQATESAQGAALSAGGGAGNQNWDGSGGAGWTADGQDAGAGYSSGGHFVCHSASPGVGGEALYQTYPGDGGFGGGGGSGYDAGGGGGGYTGGQGGNYYPAGSHKRWAAGGGSYNSGINKVNISESNPLILGNRSHGKVMVTLVSEYNEAYVFTNAGAVGQNGPTQNEAAIAYRNTALNNQVTVSNGIQSWTVPKSGNYKIEAWGASGGYGKTKGLGAKLSGEFNLTQGDVLNIVVGQEGEFFGLTSGLEGGGGGGGSFVWTSCDAAPLIIAGGGAGGDDKNGNNTGGDMNAQITSTISTNTIEGAGGAEGGGTWAGSGGAGWTADGQDGASDTAVQVILFAAMLTLVKVGRICMRVKVLTLVKVALVVAVVLVMMLAAAVAGTPVVKDRIIRGIMHPVLVRTMLAKTKLRYPQRIVQLKEMMVMGV